MEGVGYMVFPKNATLVIIAAHDSNGSAIAERSFYFHIALSSFYGN